MVLVWLLPVVLFVGLLASRRVPALPAAMLAMATTLGVAWSSAPTQVGPVELARMVAAGIWIAVPAALVILAGLFFAESVARANQPGLAVPPITAISRTPVLSSAHLLKQQRGSESAMPLSCRASRVLASRAARHWHLQLSANTWCLGVHSGLARTSAPRLRACRGRRPAGAALCSHHCLAALCFPCFGAWRRRRGLRHQGVIVLNGY